MMYACVSLDSNAILFIYLLFMVSICVFLLCVSFFLVSISSRLVTLRIYVYFFLLIDNDDYSNSCITFHVRIANQMVTESRCRGGTISSPTFFLSLFCRMRFPFSFFSFSVILPVFSSKSSLTRARVKFRVDIHKQSNRAQKAGRRNVAPNGVTQKKENPA